ncbi:Conserved_hypothetical protein [Hexamita inflata]|uniref:Transmembrane protein n=1 Tax=Hexamita inflata TaxID=28002 RepID=A0AA86UKA3_9EUKA|nr:Conserved hypothetical protein [Hexamita inflata]
MEQINKILENQFFNLVAAKWYTPIIVFGFLFTLLYVRIRSRMMHNKAQSYGVNVALAASPYFASQSPELVCANWSTYRWVATNWGFKNKYRSFRAVLNFKKSNDPLFFFMDYMTPSVNRLQLELKFKAQFEGYACIVNNKQVQSFIKLNKDVIYRLNPTKNQGKQQLCESFTGLVQIIQDQLKSELKENLEILCLNNNELKLQIKLPTNQNDIIKVVQNMMQIADKLMEMELTEQQTRQNNKKLEQSLKVTKTLKQQQQVEQDEQQVQMKIDEIAKQLEDPAVSPAEKQKLQMKLDTYMQKERMRMSKKMAAQMGMGNIGGGNKKGQRTMVMK